MKTSRIFKSIFLGEYVELLVKLTRNHESPVYPLRGYFLDMDDHHYFIGDKSDAVSMSVPKEDVGLINIVSPESVALAILNQLPANNSNAN